MRESIYNIHFSQNGKQYVYNSRNNGIIRVDKENLLELKEHYNQLYDERYLVDDECDEFQEIMDEAERWVYNDKTQLNITILLTERCNYSCVYCYQDRNASTMNIEKASLLVKRVKEELKQNSYKELHISYFGGEPLLNVDILVYLDDCFKKIANEHDVKYVPTLTTNGSLLTTDILKNIKFQIIQITLDGQKRNHELLRKSSFNFENTFDKLGLVLENSEAYLKVRLNLCRTNVNDLIPLLRYIETIYGKYRDRIIYDISKLRNYSQQALIDELDDEEYANYYFLAWKELKKISSDRHIIPHSVISKCPFVTGNAICLSPNLQRTYCSVNLSTDNKEKLNFEIRAFEKFPLECKECKVLPLCMSGCDIVRKNGNSACIPHKTIIKELLKLAVGI